MALSPEEHSRIVNDVQKGMDFATKAIPLLIKLRKASDQNRGVTFTAEEAKGLMSLLQVLRGGPRAAQQGKN